MIRFFFCFGSGKRRRGEGGTRGEGEEKDFSRVYYHTFQISRRGNKARERMGRGETGKAGSHTRLLRRSFPFFIVLFLLLRLGCRFRLGNSQSDRGLGERLRIFVFDLHFCPNDYSETDSNGEEKLENSRRGW